MMMAGKLGSPFSLAFSARRRVPGAERLALYFWLSFLFAFHDCAYMILRYLVFPPKRI